MNLSTKFQSIIPVNLTSNPHFWGLSFVTCSIVVLYYLIFYDTSVPIEESLVFLKEVRLFEFSYKMHGIFFFIPFIYATVCFWWKGPLVVWLICITMIAPQIVALSYSITSLLANTLIPLLPFVVVMLIVVQLKWREREQKAMTIREAERQTYLSEILKAQEDERQRIAQELHDDTIQRLMIIANRAHALVHSDDVENTAKMSGDIEWIRDDILEVSEDLQRLSRDLRPSILDEMGLIPALKWLSEYLSNESGIDACVIVEGMERKLAPEVDVILFRILQEALNNVRRHSNATKASVMLGFKPTSLKIVVQDNGKGFTVPQAMAGLSTGGKFGLIGMEQRSRFLGGTVAINSKKGLGTTITLEANV